VPVSDVIHYFYCKARESLVKLFFRLYEINKTMTACQECTESLTKLTAATAATVSQPDVSLRGSLGSTSSCVRHDITGSISRSGTANKTNQLKTSRRPFYGRQQELRSLQESFGSPTDDQDNGPQEEYLSCQAVLVAGESGTGKTTLVRQFLSLLEDPEVIILDGKYEENHQTDPFSALEEAFGRHIDAHKKNKALRQSILESVGDEGRALLSSVVPALNTMFVLDDTEEDDRTSYNNSAPMIDKGCKSRQLQYLFSKFIGALSCTSRLVLVLDDLQWADAASLDLLAFLLTAELSNFFLIGTYRSSEIERNNNQLGTWLEKRREYIEILHLQNHSNAEIGTFLASEIGCLCPHMCQILTDAVYEKTQGNFFFTLQVVEELKRQGLLGGQRHNKLVKGQHGFPKDNSLDCWHICPQKLLHAVSIYTAKNSTVADAVLNKIHRLSPSVQHILAVASFLRSNFDIHTLHLLLIDLESAEALNSGADTSSSGSLSLEDVRKILDDAVVEGVILNAVGSDRYKFAHDGIQEAACTVIPVGPERDQLLVRIGQSLKRQATLPNGEDWMKFVAAHHWTAVSTSVDPIELTQLYEECGSRSLSMAALEQAAIYFRQGIETVSETQDPWQNRYSLTLKLYQSSAEMEMVLGNYEKGYELGRLVLDHAHDLSEKLPVYYAMDRAFGMQERHHEALSLNMQVLEQVGQVPRSFLFLKDLMQVHHLVRNTTNEEVLGFSDMADPNKLAAIRCLSNAAIRAYCCGKKILSCLCILKQAKLAFKYGLCSEVAMALVMTGSLLARHVGDFYYRTPSGKACARSY
jgi:predicted ATPase